MKNEHATLPLQPKKLKKLAIIGPNAKTPTAGGTGSAIVNPYYITTPYDSLVEATKAENPELEVAYEEGILTHLHLPLLGSILTTGDSPESYISSWLANISARRLLNRIHCTIYENTAYFMNTDSSGNPSHLLRSLYALSDELTYQLETWWEVIPSSAKHNLINHDSDLNHDETALMLRYHACGDIICRLFLYHLCTQPYETSSLDDGLLNRALRCLDHSKEFVSSCRNKVGR